jgi:hypothetical protein
VSYLPIPTVINVREVYPHHDCIRKSFVLVCIDPNAGRRGRYSVIRVFHRTGEARCIGRELDLKLARIVAKRLYVDDGKPVKP